MTPPAPLARNTSWAAAVAAVVFDCFGTLANFGEPDFVAAFDELCHESGLALSGKELWNRWLEHGRDLARERGRDPKDPLAGPEPRFVPFREIWLPQFRRTFESLGAEADPVRARDFVVDKLSGARCYPEVAQVLGELRGRYTLAVLSNADDNFLHACLDRNGVKLETVVSSESARSYKPRARIFRHVCRLLGLAPEQILYVGDSPVADVLGAHAAGMPVAWINHAGIALPEKTPTPELELSALDQLPALLATYEREATASLPA